MYVCMLKYQRLDIEDCEDHLAIPSGCNDTENEKNSFICYQSHIYLILFHKTLCIVLMK